MKSSFFLKELIDNQIQKAIDMYNFTLPRSLPCKVVKYNNDKVDVMPTVSKGITVQTLKDVPVIKSRYNNLPINTGDIGLLIICSFDYNSTLKTPEMLYNAVEVQNGGGYMFLPLTQSMNNYCKDEKANQLYSQDGSRSMSIEDKQIVIKDKKNSITIDDDKIEIVDGNNKNSILLDSNGIVITDANKNTITLDSNGAIVEDTNKNKATLDSSGMVFKDANGNSLEMSSSGIVAKDSAGNAIETASSGITIKCSGGTKVELTAAQVAINGSALTVLP